eukprot:CAMPEP_0203812722 /NCGR_PEP_ID=MMETSP0115-20131106/4315_1 /ASSEMBLY_ACC=CAM_ASM_000227 /TAXON_ID=33651 /ORGANISM="Bicosoecid sp, Strain ms1" /LENGTH=91 /DNA_ID=CAMNT_0050721573 /DNA_START=87 /DNA_END=360 /DNA_ORIENTATION=+
MAAAAAAAPVAPSPALDVADDDDFDRQLHLLSQVGPNQLRANWRVFTKVKDAVDQGRRLENASWRLWHMAGEAAAAAAARRDGRKAQTLVA